MTTDLQKALAEAEEELALVSRQIVDTEIRKAELEGIIFSARSALGKVSEAHTLSDAIRVVLQESGEFLRRKEILKKLTPFPRKVNALSVCSTLARLVRGHEVVRGTTRAGRIGYMWNPFQKATQRWGGDRTIK